MGYPASTRMTRTKAIICNVSWRVREFPVAGVNCLPKDVSTVHVPEPMAGGGSWLNWGALAKIHRPANHYKPRCTFTGGLIAGRQRWTRQPLTIRRSRSDGSEDVATLFVSDAPCRPNQFVIDHLLQRPGIARCVGNKSAAILQPPKENGVGGPLALVHHGVGLDRGLPNRHFGHRRTFVVVDRCLIDRRVPWLEWLCWWRRRIDAGRLFRDVIAVGGHHAFDARLAPHLMHHLRDRVRDVVVAWSPEIGEASGDGQSPLVVLRNAHLSTGDLDCGGKATVDVEFFDLPDFKLGHLQCLATNDTHRG